MVKKDLGSILRAHPFFKDIKESYVDLLTGCAANHRFEAKEYLFRAEEEADKFFLIRQGSVALELPRSGAKDITIQTVGADELVGWSWLIPPYRWHLSAQAQETVLALSFDGKCIRGKFDKDPEMGYVFYKKFSVLMAQRMEETFLQMVGICD
ncbi:MAG: cyclic nucleotide-binding domain-containing protein [Elusimicrobiota bacterium]|jgi:CRP-like cAMP-binding protein